MQSATESSHSKVSITAIVAVALVVLFVATAVAWNPSRRAKPQQQPAAANVAVPNAAAADAAAPNKV